MSIRIMFRRCEHCNHVYTYNPSTGNFGMVCPECCRLQSELFSSTENTKMNKKKFRKFGVHN